MAFAFAGRTVVVTGAGGGIGAAIARAFAAEGAAVVHFHSNRAGAEAVAGRVWPRCVFLASPLAGAITGQDLVVDAGVSCHPTW